jgi:CBS domain-containing protein
MDRKVKDAMTPGVVSIERSQSVQDAAQLMRSNDIGSLPVVDADDMPIGIVTDRDITVRVVAEGNDPRTVQVAEIVSRGIVTVDSSKPLGNARKLMADHQIRRLPVVDDGKLVGILAQADVAFEAKPKETGEMLADISRPASVAHV